MLKIAKKSLFFVQAQAVFSMDLVLYSSFILLDLMFNPNVK